MLTYPKKFMLCSGTGVADQRLVAFDNALISANIANYNLLKVSSILPIGCVRTDKLDKKLGSALLVAYASISSNELGRTLSSAVAAGIPDNESDVGVIMEFSDYCDAKTAEATVINMVKEAMKNHNIPCKDIISTAEEATVTDSRYVSLISALAMW